MLAQREDPGTPVTVGGADAFVAAWVAQQLDMQIEDFGPCRAIGIVHDGKLICGWVYSDYREMKSGASMQASVASTSPRWGTRRVLRDVFGYPFLQQGVTRFWTAISRKNKRARSAAERLGFRLEGIARRAHDGFVDSAVYSMLPGECPWIEGAMDWR